MKLCSVTTVLTLCDILLSVNWKEKKALFISYLFQNSLCLFIWMRHVLDHRICMCCICATLFGLQNAFAGYQLLWISWPCCSNVLCVCSSDFFCFFTINSLFPAIRNFLLSRVPLTVCCQSVSLPLQVSPSLHTCWDISSGTAPEPTAAARTAHSQTSSGSETQVTSRQPRSRSSMSHTPLGKTGEAPTQCSRSLHTVFLQAACSECSARPHANQQNHQTAAVWRWWEGCRCGCGGWKPPEGSHGTVLFHTAIEREDRKNR